MRQKTKESIIRFITCIAMLVTTSGAFAADEQLEPQGMDYAGIYPVRQIDPNLTGSDVNIAVICRSFTYLDGEPQNDYRPAVNHRCLEAAKFNFYDSNETAAGISPHSTAICSILFGQDSYAAHAQLGDFEYHGIIPNANANIYEFRHFLTDYVFELVPPQADIITLSIGSDAEDWWTRGIEALAQHYGLIIVAGIGNGSNSFDPPLYPAASANVIGVGVIDSVDVNDLETRLSEFSLAYPEHSSFGPTGDGRCKPDIVTIGNCLVADVNDMNSYKPTNNGSSFSTPVVAGTIGLLVQKAKNEPNLADAVSRDGGNCVIKAIVLNSATKLPYWHKGRLTKDDDHTAPLDFIQGAGMLNAVGAYKHLISKLNTDDSDTAIIGWDNNILSEDNTQNSYQIKLAEPADKFITATIAWNRHYKREYPFKAEPEKDANLRLELWAIDTESPNENYLLDYSDSIVDNLEHIYCKTDPNYTDYEIIIRFSDSNLPVVEQRYGLAWNAEEKQVSNNILLYDLNADGIVNDTDIKVMFDYLLSDLQKSQKYVLGDIDDSGRVDVNDLEILMDNIDAQTDWYTTEQNTPE